MNDRIRAAMREHRLFAYELADALGISETTLFRKLRRELPQEEQEKILDIIRDLAVERREVH